jgi:hypothetical protein
VLAAALAPANNYSITHHRQHYHQHSKFTTASDTPLHIRLRHDITTCTNALLTHFERHCNVLDGICTQLSINYLSHNEFYNIFGAFEFEFDLPSSIIAYCSVAVRDVIYASPIHILWTQMASPLLGPKLIQSRYGAM